MKRFKTLVAFLTALTLCVPTLSVYAEEVSPTSIIATSGTFKEEGSDLKWDFNESSKTLTIEGNGTMDAFLWRNDGQLSEIVPKTEHVILKKGIASISGDAFTMCQNLISIEIPDTVTSITDSAFAYCHKLQNITIPAGVNVIRENTFAYCTSLENVVFKEPVNSLQIEDYAFSSCVKLSHINLPNKISYIGENAFYECMSLKALEIPAGIDNLSLWSCYTLRDVIIRDGVKKIPKDTFNMLYSMQSISIPESVSKIETRSFDCDALKKIEIHNPNCEIESGAIAPFAVIYGKQGSTAQKYAEQNGMTFVSFNDNYTPDDTIVSGTCDTLSWEFNNKSKTLTIEGNGEMTNQDWMTVIDKEQIEHIIIKEGITTISDFAFAEYVNLTDIQIPNTITLIGDYAFGFCTNLQKISIPKSVKSIGAMAFEMCFNLKDFSIEPSNNVFSIQRQTFTYCVSLESIVLPDNINYIEDNAFLYCYSLNDVTTKADIDEFAFGFCYNLKNVSLGDGISSIESYALGDSYQITDIVIPASVKKIGSFAISADTLNSITIKNPNCDLSGGFLYNAYDWPVKPIIYGYSGSTAENYALAYNFPFKSLGSSTLKKGDANGDGSVDILDVIAVNRTILGKERMTDEQVQAVDCNGNNVPDSTDSLILLKYIVGLIDTL